MICDGGGAASTCVLQKSAVKREMPRERISGFEAMFRMEFV